jgi:hypothetical protein
MFQTGRGRQVTVSEESLKKVDHLFRADASEPAAPMEAAGGVAGVGASSGGGGSGGSMFQTGRGRQVTVSEESLKKVDHLFRADASEPAAPMEAAGGVAGVGASSGGGGADVSDSIDDGGSGREEGAEDAIEEEVEMTYVDASLTMTEAVSGTAADDIGLTLPQTPEGAEDVHKEAISTTEGVLAETLSEAPAEDVAPAVGCATLPAVSGDEPVTDPVQMEMADDVMEEMELLMPLNGPRDMTLSDLTSGGLGRPTLRDLGVPHRHTGTALLTTMGIRPVTLTLSASNAHLLTFDDEGLPSHLLEESASDAQLAYLKLMLEERKLPHDRWVLNHYRLIVWKLASMERAFAHKLAGRYLTEERVHRQLRSRFDKEVAGGQRPALRLILNGDAAPGLFMILCVSKIYPRAPPPKDDAEAEDGEEKKEADVGTNGGKEQVRHVRVELTDGWYTMDAGLDEGLSSNALKGKIRVGMKLALCNAGIQELGGGLEPWDDRALTDIGARPYLTLSINSTRPARWDAKLGFHHASTLRVPISSIVNGGGMVSGLEVVILRLYPIMYHERTQGPDGPIMRVLTEAEEHEAARAHEAECQLRMERLSEAMEKEIEKAAGADEEGGGGDWGDTVQTLVSGGLKQQAMRRQRRESAAFMHMEKVRNQVLDDPMLQRTSKPFIRIKVCSVKSVRAADGSREVDPARAYWSKDAVREDVALVTFWDPSDGVVDGVHEGSHMFLRSLSVPKPRGAGPAVHPLRLNATNSTRLLPLASPASASILSFAGFEPRSARLAPNIRSLREKFDASHGPFVTRDFDVVGYLLGSIVWAIPQRQEERDQGVEQTTIKRMFFVDATRCILCVEQREYGPQQMEAPSSAATVWAFADLVYESYDPKTDTVMARYVNVSTSRKTIPQRAGREAGLRKHMEAVRQWGLGDDGRRVITWEGVRLASLLQEDPGDALPAGAWRTVDYRETMRGRIVSLRAGVRGSGTLLSFFADCGDAVVPVVCRTEEIVRLLQRLVGEKEEEGSKTGLQGSLEAGVTYLLQRESHFGLKVFDMLLQRLPQEPSSAQCTFDLIDLIPIPAVHQGRELACLLCGVGADVFDG